MQSNYVPTRASDPQVFKARRTSLARLGSRLPPFCFGWKHALFWLLQAAAPVPKRTGSVLQPKRQAGQ